MCNSWAQIGGKTAVLLPWLHGDHGSFQGNDLEIGIWNFLQSELRQNLNEHSQEDREGIGSKAVARVNEAVKADTKSASFLCMAMPVSEEISILTG